MNGVPIVLGIIGAILGSLGLSAFIYAFLILAQLGRKLGAVTKMRPYYRGYYIAVAFAGLALLTRLVRAAVFWAPPENLSVALSKPVFYLFLYHLPLAVGMSLGLAITWYYWNWLLKEQ